MSVVPSSSSNLMRGVRPSGTASRCTVQKTYSPSTSVADIDLMRALRSRSPLIPATQSLSPRSLPVPLPPSLGPLSLAPLSLCLPPSLSRSPFSLRLLARRSRRGAAGPARAETESGSSES
eukprot:scaffold315607_cov39-Tisochrysis_lutea.AAC.3